MRLAVVSDIHGNIWALEAVLAEIRRMGDVECIVNVGDILSGPLEPAATAELLMPLNLPTIAGNHERQLLACAGMRGGDSDQFAFEHTTPVHQAWLAGLPGQLALRPDIWICHGSPRSDLEYLLERVDGGRTVLDTDAAIEHKLDGHAEALLICGHSHVPRGYRAPQGTFVVNPGSVGLQAYDDDHVAWHIVENGSPHARFAVCEDSGARGWSVSHHAVAYDWEQASRTALRNGAADWARWLRTGRA